MKTSSLHFLWCVFFSVANMALAVLPPADPPLPGYDRRAGTASGLGVVSPAQQLAVERLRLRQPQIQVEFDPITSGPKSITARGAFLSGSQGLDRKSTRLNSSHLGISYAVFCLKKK